MLPRCTRLVPVTASAASKSRCCSAESSSTESDECPQDFLVAERHDVTFDAGLVRNRPCIHAEVAPVRCAGFGKTAKPRFARAAQGGAPGCSRSDARLDRAAAGRVARPQGRIRAERAQRGLLVRESLRVTLGSGRRIEADRRPKHSLKMCPVRPDIICDSIEQRERCQDSGALLLYADTRPRRAEGIGHRPNKARCAAARNSARKSARVIQDGAGTPVVDLSDERKIPASVGLETPEHRLTPEPGAEDFKIIGTEVGAIIGGSGTRGAMSEVALIAGPKCHAEVAEVTWSAQRCMSGRRAASESVRR